MSKIEKALAAWPLTNDFLRKSNEKDTAEMLAAEKAGKRRVQYLLRIHGSMNKKRAKRERAELVKLAS